MTELPEHVHKAAVRYSEPLFLSSPYAIGGHNARTANGTITYVRHRGETFGITCAHVYYQQFSPVPERWLTVRGRENFVFPLHETIGRTPRSLFRATCGPDCDDGPDIAIARLPEAVTEFHFERKGKEAFNLDEWVEPDWSELTAAVASGFPTEHKSEGDGFVRAPFVAVVAELTRPISPADDIFLMASTLQKEHNFYFSGMSGGAVYCVSDSDRTLELIGIVFAGTPGGSADWNARGESSFLTDRDVQIRARTLTPEKFEHWLELAELK